MNIGLLDTFLAILEPTNIGPVIYQGFIPGFMDDFLQFLRSGMLRYNSQRCIEILQLVFECYPQVFDEYFCVIFTFLIFKGNVSSTVIKICFK